MSLTPTALKTSNYTASAGDLVTCQVGIEVTLPNSPSPGDEVGVFVFEAEDEDYSRNVRIINPAGGGDILGRNVSYNSNGSEGTSLYLYRRGEIVRLQYLGSDDWLLVEDGRSPQAFIWESSSSSGQVIPNNVLTQVEFDDGDTNNNSGIGDDDKIIIRRAGRYAVVGRWGLNTGGVVVLARTQLQVNGSPVRTTTSMPGAAAANAHFEVADVLYLGAGAEVTLHVQQISSDSSSKSVLTSADGRARLGVTEIR